MIRSIGVIGAGQMGNGIAHVASLKGYPVHLVDIDQRQIDKAKDVIGQNMARQVKRELITDADRQAAMGRISFGRDFGLLKDCDIVIEAATEKEEVKREILKQLCPVLKPEAIIASNTSSISITRLAAATDRPARFMGMHFMNPVPLMKLVELIRGLRTSDETFRVTRDLGVKLGKDCIESRDCASQ